MLLHEETPNSKQEKLRAENKLKKLKMSIETGAEFSEINKDLPPAIENKFLKNIEKFEETFRNAEQVTLFDYIGKPEYQNAETIPDDKIGDALDNLMRTLNENNVVLETLCEVNDRVMYDFITKELFNYKIENIRIQRMTTNFLYEEFHPNHEYDIRNHSTDFFRDFLNKNSDFYTTFLTQEAEENNTLYHFRNSFQSFRLNEFNILNLTFNEINANLTYEADFSATIENSYEIQHFKGKGRIELLYQYDFWCVDKVIFPPTI